MPELTTPKIEALGKLALERGLVTQDQIKICLAHQEALRKTGKLLPLGQILIQRRILTSEQVSKLLLTQKGVPADAPLVNGKYALVRSIGRGGAGEVFLARDTTLDRPVAIKVLRDEVSQNKKAVERFLREARVLAKIRHPNVVGVHETGTYQGRHYFVMDYVDGTPLDEVLAPGSLPLRHKIEILAQAAAAVGELHRHGVVHRDLKPSNVIIDAQGRPILLDFGLAMDASRRTKITVTGTLLGTPFYMAPEQVEGRHVDPHTDVYTLGVILYEMLTGKLPFRSENEFELYRQISSHDPQTPSTIDRHVPRDLEVICLKAMDKDPAQRYANAAEFAEDLQRYLQGAAIKARPAPITVRMARRVKEHRIAAAAVTGSLVVALIAGAIFLINRAEKSAVVAKTLREADRAFAEGNLEEARERYNQVEGLDSGNRAASDGIAKINERASHIATKLREAEGMVSKDPEAAERGYSAVLELDRNNEAARTGIQAARAARETHEKFNSQAGYLNGIREIISAFESDTRLPADDYLARNPEAKLLNLVDQLRARIDGFEPFAKADTHYLLGRIYGCIGRYDDARRELDQAIKLSDLGRYHGERGRVALSSYRRAYVRATQDFRRNEIQKLLEKLKPLRDEVLNEFKAALSRGAGEEWETRFAQAYVDYAEGRVDAALKICKELEASRIHESVVLKLLGTICLDRMWGNRKSLEESVSWFEKASTIYRSDGEAQSGLGNAKLYKAQYVPELFSDFTLLNEAAAALSVAVRVQPCAAYHLSLARVYYEIAERLTITGKDSSDAILKARDNVRFALQFERDNSDAHNWLAITYTQSAAASLFRADGQVDPDAAESDIALALHELEEAIRLDAGEPQLYQNRAVARGLRAVVRMARGNDASDDLEICQADIKHAFDLGDNSSSLHEADAVTHLWRLINELSQKREALPDLNAAIAACDEAVKVPYAADRARTYVFRGILQTIRGLMGLRDLNKKLCDDSLKGAISDFRKAGKLDPGYSIFSPEAFDAVRRAMVLQLEMKDAREAYKEATEGLTKILNSDLPKTSNAYVLRMFSLLLRGFSYYFTGKPREAVADWEELIQRIPPFKFLLGPMLEDAKKKAAKQP